MSQANEPITLKIHHGDDIRRFHLSQLKWSELTELLSSNYPTPYTLKYRDTDNDMVTMVTQQDLQDASDMSQDVIHLYVMDKDVIPAAGAAPATASAPDIDMKSSEDDLASQLSHEEISTLFSECLSDPAVITAIPPFLTTFIDQLTSNMSTPTPLSTSCTQSLQQHPTIRDHVILSVVLPRLQQKLNQADQNNVAARIPSHVFPMVKGFIPMLPMFLPSIIPMITKFMSESSTSTDTQAQTNPFANSPFMSMLGPMLRGMQQPAQTAVPSATTPASATSPTTNSAAQVNPFGLLAPLLAGAAANSSAASPTNSNSATQAQAQANPLLGLLGPLLAANAANSGNQPNPFASMFQQYPQPPGGTNTNTATNTDYTEQLATLESMGLGSHDLNLSLLQQWNGDVERVMEFLSTMA